MNTISVYYAIKCEITTTSGYSIFRIFAIFACLNAYVRPLNLTPTLNVYRDDLTTLKHNKTTGKNVPPVQSATQGRIAMLQVYVSPVGAQSRFEA